MRLWYLKLIFTGFFLTTCQQYVYSQTNSCEEIVFSYDALGNRIKRELVVVACDDDPVDDDGGNHGRVGQLESNESTDSFETTTIVVFPNPTEDQLFVQTSSREIIKQCLLYDQGGKLIYITNPNASNTMISLANMSSGIYLLKVNCDKANRNFKVTKR